MYAIIRFFGWLAYKIYFNISFEGKENIPKKGGFIFASNHRSYADPVIISLPVRSRFAYMAKKELFVNPFMRALIKSLGAFPVDRGADGIKAVETSMKMLESGRNLLIFPEGTRSYDGKLGRGKLGASLIAAGSGADIVPVAIIFEGKLKFRRKIVVRYGKLIRTKEICPTGNTEITGANKEIKQLKTAMMSGIAELLPTENEMKGETGGAAEKA